MSRASKTTEFYVFLAAVVAVVITAVMVGQDENTGIDPFGALDALDAHHVSAAQPFQSGESVA